MSIAFCSQSRNRSWYSGCRNTSRAQFRSCGGSSAQSPKRDAVIEFHARMSVRRPAMYAGTPSIVSSSWQQRPAHDLRPRRRLLLVLLRLGEVREVGVLGVRQPQGAGDGVEDLRGDVLPVALFEPRVVGHGHPGQLGQLLAAQPRHPAVPPEVRQPHVLRLEPGPPGAQELAELGTPVQGAAGGRRCPGVVRRIARSGCSSIRSIIPGRTHTSLTPPVVGPLDVRRTVDWVNAETLGRLGVAPGQKAAGREPLLGELPA